MSQKHTLFDPTAEHEAVRMSLREFVKKEIEPQALESDRKEKFNLPLFKKIGRWGLLGLTVKEKQFGGMGLDAVSACAVHEELSYSDPGFCLAYLAHAVLCTHNISQNANEEQKKKWLPPLCSGEWVGAMAMTEPDCGTDVLGMQTTAKRQGENYIIQGKKMWITNAVVDENKTLADGCVLYTKLSGGGSKSVCSFFIQKGAPGYSSGQVMKDKAGMRASYTAELVFEDCKVPLFHRMGEEGRAVYQMMKNLEFERLALAAMSLGIARRAFNEMNKYASSRYAFGKKIRSFGQIQRYIADSYAELQSCRTYVYSTAHRLDFNKAGQRLDSDSAKLAASRTAKLIADRAIQVLGAAGYVGEYPVERLWRDSKLLEIGGGTSEALQKNITNELEGHHGV